LIWPGGDVLFSLLDVENHLLFRLNLVEDRHCIVNGFVVHMAVSHRHGKRLVSKYPGDTKMGSDLQLALVCLIM
jgi:hypothetical protein